VAFVTKEGGNLVLRRAAERALYYLTAAHAAGEATLTTVLAAGEPTLASFLGDYARKGLRKADADSDDDE